jgi:hypothetical protein
VPYVHTHPAVTRRLARTLALAILAAPVVAMTPAASASACGGKAPSGRLDGVAALSSIDAWAVGSYRGNPAARTLIEHWDGNGWCRVQGTLILHWDGTRWTRVLSP